MTRSRGLQAAASRDPHLTIRRVERQQYIIERLHASRNRLTHQRLADELGVTERTIARDIERLRHSGVPITVVPGRGGGAIIENVAPAGPINLDVPEIAVLMASLAAVGPTVSESATSAMNKLATAVAPSA
ncbi:YafY family protein [Pseudactinotalea sp. HY158]|uniref:helix-turn-helix transcriptional regulator n=1 Tax=Pseudactinotalea sp. HY158 TaxID=2654547 RepID=UPI001E4298CD|nr:HTH domain-containing protein [Pseudactinotalea sp. HY158]